MGEFFEGLAGYAAQMASQVWYLFTHLLAIGVGPKIERLLDRFHRLRGLRLQPGTPVVLVVVDRPVSELAGHRTYMTSEDVSALSDTQKTLWESGLNDIRICVREASRFDKDDPWDHTKNLVLFCRNNPVTDRFMAELRARKTFDWKFVTSANGQRHLEGAGGIWKSPSYQQEEDLLAMGRPVWEGLREDYALLARVENPLARVENPDNTSAAVYIMAGIRGLGTQGAAAFFRARLRYIHKRTKGKEFAWVLRVPGEKGRIHVDRIVVVHYGD